MGPLPERAGPLPRPERAADHSLPLGSLLRTLTLVAVLVALSAWAGETFIGRLTVSDAGSISNATTGYGSAGCASQSSPLGAGACAQAFPIGICAKLTIQAVGACCVSVNRASTDAGMCMLLADGEKFPTSVACATSPLGPLMVGLSDGGSTMANVGGMPDGGTYNGALVSITPPAGSTTCSANVFTRSGTE